VQLAVLLQIAEHGCADRKTLAAMVVGAGQRDLIQAITELVEHGLLHCPPQRRDPLDALAALGRLLMTSTGRRWLDADVA
jgi:hypothetical protein